jgi:redox-sensitive bicupin YhaK (pirin superfamily)
MEVIMMIQVIPSAARHTADNGWLLSRFSFSFGDYNDPNNTNFGAVRVFNDDVIQPDSGFGMHPHRDMEIISYIIEGTLEHKDSIGNVGLIEAGEVQRITAGTGILHSEYNASTAIPVRLLQMWIIPEQRGLTPSWEQKQFTKEQQLNQLLPVVSGKAADGVISINQDATMYLSTLESGQQLTYKQSPERKILLFVIKGQLSLNEKEALSEGDSARITNLADLNISTANGAQLILFDLA